MDGRNGRPYGLPNGPASGYRPPPSRPLMASQPSSQQPMRDPPLQSPPLQSATSPNIPQSLIAKADQYADDKRRIVDSCFSKREPNGMLTEEYICHIRVVEDAKWPTSPPPPDSSPENKKERIVVLAVRCTGRVRMHKGRENTNGTFSIGKTWNFEEMTSIESFTNRQPRPDLDVQQVLWAGDTGFTVALGKPYFWNTNSVREKSFFIGSLAKIFKRYSGGSLPQLIGFTQAELDAIHAHIDRTSNPPPVGQRPPTATSQPPIPIRGGAVQRPQDSPNMGYNESLASPGFPPPLSARRPAFSPIEPAQSMSPPPDSLRMRSVKSREQMAQSADPSPYGRQTPQSSVSDVREGTPDSLKMNNRRGGGFYQPPPLAPPSREGPIGNGLGISNRAVNGDSNSRGPNNRSTDSLPQAAPAPLPERKRPPLLAGTSSRYSQNDSAVPKPLAPSRAAEKPQAPSPAPIEIPKKATDRYVIGSSAPDPETPKAEPAPKPVAAPEEKVDSPKTETESADAKASDVNTSSEDVSRPGLGRMFGNNKKTTRDLIRQAATTYTAFKPRAGGAAAKLFANDTKPTEGDGITGVFSAPSQINRSKTTDSNRSAGSQESNSIQATPISAVGAKPSLPDMTLTSPGTTEKQVEQAPLRKDGPSAVKSMSDLQKAAEEAHAKSKAAEEEAARKKLRRTPKQVWYLENMGIDVSKLEGRCLEEEALLDEFWPEPCWHTKTFEELQAELRRELSRVQTASWFEHLALHDDGRQEALRLIDRAMEEAETLEKLLTIYSVELGSLNQDIAYIEAQSQGLSVQSANQKLLLRELQELLSTIIVPPHILEPIYQGTFVSIDGLEAVERSVLAVFLALCKGDPDMRLNYSWTPEQYEEASMMSTMKAIQEKRPLYMDAANTFLGRFKNYMDIAVGKAILQMQSEAQKLAGQSGPQVNFNAINSGRSELWKYSPLFLFAKSVDFTSWRKLVQSYSSKMQTLYFDTVKSLIQRNVSLARGSPGEEQELLFTYIEAQADVLALGTRKLTVKRNQAFARTFRAASGEKTARQAGGSVMPFEAVQDSLNEITPLLTSEQNFIADFFHATSLGTSDFAELVLSTLAENRTAPKDLSRKPFEPEPIMAQFVKDTMAGEFQFLEGEVKELVNWALNIGPLQGVGILYALHQQMERIDDGFLFQVLHGISSRLESDWDKFVQLQIRAIEETKVKIKKRKGVLHFMKVFPSFSGHLEGMLPPANEEGGRVRDLIDKGYKDIIKAMFDSLRVIAKESPAVAAHSGVGDPEDKEALNYHILLIENMNHYVEYVDERGSKPLTDGKTKALDEFEEHLSLYLNAVIRRPLGKIMDFTESLAQALDSTAVSSNPVALSSKPAFTPSAYKKVLSAHDPKELRKGVEALRRRVEKHFGDFVDKDEQNNSNNSHHLIQKVLGRCEERFAAEVEKMNTLPKQIYGPLMDEGNLSSAGLGVGRDDVSKWFKGMK